MILKFIIIFVLACAIIKKNIFGSDAQKIPVRIEDLLKGVVEPESTSTTDQYSTSDWTVPEEKFVTKIFRPLGTAPKVSNPGRARYERIGIQRPQKDSAEGQVSPHPQESVLEALKRLGLNRQSFDAVAYQCASDQSIKLECPVGWMQSGRSCYYLCPNLDQTATFQGAIDICMQKGGKLLELNNINEWNGLSDLLSRQVQTFTAGAEDGIWLSIPSVRNAKNPMQCDQFVWDKTSWLYSQEHCLHKQWYICEKELTCPDHTEQSQICSSAWDELNKCCYYKASFDEYTSFADAQNTCESKSAKLWMPVEQDYNVLVSNLEVAMSQEANHQYFDGFWIQSNQYTWNVHGTGMTACSELRRGLSGWGLDAEICSHSQSFICKMCPAAELPAPPSVPPSYNSVQPDYSNYYKNESYNQISDNTSFRNRTSSNRTLMNTIFNNRTTNDKNVDRYDPRNNNRNQKFISRFNNTSKWQTFQSNASSSSDISSSLNTFNQTVVRTVLGANSKPSSNMNELFKPAVEDKYEAGDCREWKYMCPASMASCMDTSNGYRCVCLPGMSGDGYYCTDIDECAHTPNACGDTAHCMNTYGSYKCVCGNGYQMMDDGTTCQESAICVAYGDPHYRSFDGHTIHYQGICRVILSQGIATNVNSRDPNLDTLPSGSQIQFHVEADAENRDGNKDFSWMGKVYLIFNGNEYTIGGGGPVLVNGQRVQIPYSDASRFLRITENNGHHVIHTNFGLEIDHDGDVKAEIKLVANYKGRVNGICGNYNEYTGDDMAGPDGRKITNDIEFGNSWISPSARKSSACVKSLIESNGTSSVPGGGSNDGDYVQRQCNPGSQAYADAESACFPITDFSGVFQTCLSLIRKDLVEIYESCVMDVCASGEPFRCQALSYAAETCALKGVNLDRNWARQLGCDGLIAGQQLSSKCAPGLIHSDCGPCIATCNDVMSQSVQCSSSECHAGCFCPQGTQLNPFIPEHECLQCTYSKSSDQVLDDTGKCIPKDQCGCKIGLLYMELGTNLYQNECSIQCSCYKQGDYHVSNCIPIECHENASCVGPFGAQACYCNPGFQGNGTFCDPQYKLKLFDISEYLRRLH